MSTYPPTHADLDRWLCCHAVFEFDRRAPPSEARLLAILWDAVSIKAEANSICSPARKPWLIAVGGSDGRVRLYDRRMASDKSAKEAQVSSS